MKIGRFLALGALAYGAYYAYKRREDIKEEILDLNQSRENISHDLDNIKRNLDIIKEQNLVLADIKQDLNYKTRVFKKTSNPDSTSSKNACKSIKVMIKNKGKQPVLLTFFINDENL